MAEVGSDPEVPEASKVDQSTEREDDETSSVMESNVGEDECIICRTEIADFRDRATLQCGHTFHVDCVNRWLNVSQTCPLCRSDVDVKPMRFRARVVKIAVLATMGTMTLAYVCFGLLVFVRAHDNWCKQVSPALQREAFVFPVAFFCFWRCSLKQLSALSTPERSLWEDSISSEITPNESTDKDVEQCNELQGIARAWTCTGVAFMLCTLLRYGVPPCVACCCRTDADAVHRADQRRRAFSAARQRLREQQRTLRQLTQQRARARNDVSMTPAPDLLPDDSRHELMRDMFVSHSRQSRTREASVELEVSQSIISQSQLYEDESV
ncbi:MAG: hypothetical protein MHM6MM_004072 [Cercozoa sp. M6MM]